MKVFLTGATGFVGSHLLHRLTTAGHSVVALVRPSSQEKLSELLKGLNKEQADSVELLEGDITSSDALSPEKLEGCDAVMHLVGIIRAFPSRGITFDAVHVQGTRNVCQAAKQAGTRHFLHMSALGTRENAATDYHRSKYIAEEIVRSSGMKWTIFRPSFIIGEGSEFIEMLSGMVRKRIVPMIGRGDRMFQPVCAGNVSEGFLKGMQQPQTAEQIYEVGGPEVLSYRSMLDILASVMDCRIMKIPMPAGLLRPVAAVMQRFPSFPLTNDQITMFMEGSVCKDNSIFFETFGIEPVSFENCLRGLMGTGT